MIIYKRIYLLSSVLLMACAPHQRVETIQSTPLIQSTPNTKNDHATDSKNTTKNLLSPSPQTSSSPEEEKSPAQSNENGKEHATQNIAPTTKISSWNISGSMAARAQSKGWTASINWVQRGPNQYQIRLFGPLGSGTIIITKTNGQVTFKDGPKTITSSNASELLKQKTGVSLPVNSLYYWVRGIPAPGPVGSITRDQANHVMTLKQAGYAIEYKQYTSVNQYSLPKNIKLVGHGIFIKLVINHWQI